MEPERTGAKGEGGVGGAQMPPVQVRRKVYPKPPGLLKRFGRLLLVPESWAEAGRYPFHVTLWPLIMAVVISAGMIGLGQGYRVLERMKIFAGGYDLRYAPMQLSSDGTLSWAGPVKQQVTMGDEMQALVVDPTDKTKMDDLKTIYACLVTSKNVQIRMGPLDPITIPLTDLAGDSLPAAGTAATINGTTLRQYLDRNGTAFVIEMFLFVGLGKIFTNSIWVVVMIFSIWPLAVIAARTGHGDLAIPRRAAVRFAAAVLIPLLMLDGVLDLIGHPVSGTIGAQGAWMFWFFAGGILAFWAGKMAKSMYSPKVKPTGRR